MEPQPKDSIEFCNDYLDLTYQQPSSSFDYNFKESLENRLGLGKYQPFATHKCSAEYMLRLGAFNYLYTKYDQQRHIFENLKNYIHLWKNCINAHENKKKTQCYDKDFRDLMNKSFVNLDHKINALDHFDSKAFYDFDEVLRFARVWNELQSMLVRTFYAHKIIFPKWLGLKPVQEQNRGTCAECKLFDSIGPPTTMFIALSAFFMPYETLMPDGRVIPEGVLAHDQAGTYHELHEHVHAYLHEKKAANKKHLNCNWVEEGIADWTAMQILQPRKKERSLFLEIYDFWIIFNSINDTHRKKLIQCWCYEPEKVRWRQFVSDMRSCVYHHRAGERENLTWDQDEKCNIEINLQKYFI